MTLLRLTVPSLLLVALVTVALRLIALPGSREDTLTPDGARLLNLTRAVGRGEGFVIPEAFPAWIAPARLPMPERLKEPGYPVASAALAPLAGGPFAAARALSLLAGLALPFALWALVRRLHPDRAAATLAALVGAASPVLVVQSVYVMAEALFALMLTVAFLAAEHAAARSGRAARLAGAAAGVALGLAVLVRVQGLVAAPALLWRLWPGRARGRRGVAAAALLAGFAVLAPYLARNLALFGTPLPVESRLVGLLAYADPTALTLSLDPPPPFAAWALAHPVEVLRHAAESAWRLAAHAVPDALLGLRVALLPLAAGLVVALRGWRAWGPVMLYQGLTLVLVLPVNWPDRYLTSVAPLFAAQAGVGLVALLAPLEVPAGWRRHLPVVLAAALLAVLVARGARVASTTADTYRPESEAARAHGPWLAHRTAPGDAVMAEITSYWAWWSDRPAVSPPLSEPGRVSAELARLRVRWAALRLSRLDTLAARFPERRLPRELEPVLTDPARDVAIFRVRSAATAPRP